jgi:hypothetical protein
LNISNLLPIKGNAIPPEVNFKVGEELNITTLNKNKIGKSYKTS